MSSLGNSSQAPFDEYLGVLDSMVGVESRFKRMPGPDNGLPVWLAVYDAVPDEGGTTAFTFGLSSVRHESWRMGTAPELVINVDSSDDDWWLALAAFCTGLRGICPFSLGNTLRLGRPISAESSMSAFFLFWPTILEKHQQEMRMSDRTINFVQAYPIYEGEIDLISRIGPEKFFMIEGLDFSDVSRSEFTAPARGVRPKGKS
jgi:hypothetical protein